MSSRRQELWVFCPGVVEREPSSCQRNRNMDCTKTENKFSDAVVAQVVDSPYLKRGSHSHDEKAVTHNAEFNNALRENVPQNCQV